MPKAVMSVDLSDAEKYFWIYLALGSRYWKPTQGCVVETNRDIPAIEEMLSMWPNFWVRNAGSRDCTRERYGAKNAGLELIDDP